MGLGNSITLDTESSVRDLVTRLKESVTDDDSIHLAVIHTELGEIYLELYAQKAPITVSNFEKLVSEGAYNGTCFYRTVHADNQPNDDAQIEIIQGGLKDNEKINKYSGIDHENTEKTGINHLDGTISMARKEPGTASTEFFICIGAQPELNYRGQRNPDGEGFAAFGKVVEGMDIVRSIQRSGDKDQYIIKPVTIHSIELLE